MASDTLVNVLMTQNNLLTEAAEALPHQFSQCTYSKGAIRQAVYLCRTCAVPRGVCSACSIACHTDHEQLELFPKRAFRCDCPTGAVPHACALHAQPEDANAANAYGPNFRGTFCRCGRAYDAESERETMIQCLACEDWFHESCCNLRERPSSREPSPERTNEPTADDPAPEQGEQPDDDDDGASDASSSGLPPPLIPASQYDSFVCGACVTRIPTLKRYAGTDGAMMIVRDTPSAPWTVSPGTKPTDETVNVSTSGSKRPRADSAGAEGQEAKRARVESDEKTAANVCLAPHVAARAQAILSALGAEEPLGAGDVFLTEGFPRTVVSVCIGQDFDIRSWRACLKCLPSLESHPFLLEEEETYEPPADPDSGLSLEELGMRALQHLPRDRAIDGIRAFNSMRDDLMGFLRPFAQEGRVVAESDISAFFEARKQGNA